MSIWEFGLSQKHCPLYYQKATHHFVLCIKPEIDQLQDTFHIYSDKRCYILWKKVVIQRNLFRYPQGINTTVFTIFSAKFYPFGIIATEVSSCGHVIIFSDDLHSHHGRLAGEWMAYTNELILIIITQDDFSTEQHHLTEFNKFSKSIDCIIKAVCNMASRVGPEQTSVTLIRSLSQAPCWRLAIVSKYQTVMAVLHCPMGNP